MVRLHMLTGGYHSVRPTPKGELAGEAFFIGGYMKQEDIEDAIERIPESGCWIWMRGTKGASGYGSINSTTAHRFVYESIVGVIPKGLELDHLCRVRCCVNPNHLEPVTIQENVARGFSPHAINARKTHCPKGHAYSPENTIYRTRGSRECKICQSERFKKYYEKNKKRLIAKRAEDKIKQRSKK